MKNEQKEFLDFLIAQNKDSCNKKLHLFNVINSACKLFTVGTPEYNACRIFNSKCYKCKHCL